MEIVNLKNKYNLNTPNWKNKKIKFRTKELNKKKIKFRKKEISKKKKIKLNKWKCWLNKLIY
jgi:flagellar basal body rod protein FlgB